MGLEKAHIWLKAPSIHDDKILRRFFAPSSMMDTVLDSSRYGYAYFGRTSDLQRELWRRRAEDPRCLWLYTHPQLEGGFRYVREGERRDWGPAKIWIEKCALNEAWTKNGTLHRRGWKPLWLAKPFPWVDMTGAMDSTIRLLRSRTMAMTEEQRKLLSLACPADNVQWYQNERRKQLGMPMSEL